MKKINLMAWVLAATMCATMLPGCSMSADHASGGDAAAAPVLEDEYEIDDSETPEAAGFVCWGEFAYVSQSVGAAEPVCWGEFLYLNDAIDAKRSGRKMKCPSNLRAMGERWPPCRH